MTTLMSAAVTIFLLVACAQDQQALLEPPEQEVASEVEEPAPTPAPPSSKGRKGGDQGARATDSEPDTPNQTQETVEYQLAVIDGAAFDPSDPAVAQYAKALRKLEPKCDETRTTLGDMAVKAQELLGNGGVQESLLSILQSVERSIPKVAPRMPCSDIFASYVVLRGGKA